VNECKSTFSLLSTKNKYSIEVGIICCNIIFIKVLDGNLYFAINGAWVVASLPDNLNPNPGAASLMVINNGGASSAIVFANFELQV
jgi:hypothetical protein